MRAPDRAANWAALFLVLAAGCGKVGKSAELRVGLITPGSIADQSWNAGAYAGLQQIRDSLGIAISHQEARTPGAQEEALRAYAAQGYQLVFGHGFEFQQPAERVSAEYPGTIFVVTSGERVQGNVTPLVFRFEEGTFLAGMLAGALSKTGKIGFVGGIELPPIERGYRGWLNGALRSNPKVETRVTYLNNFDDAAAGREAALAMIRLGVDMLHHNADEAAKGMFQAVKESPGVFAFGANADQRALAPDRVIASAVIDLPRAFLLVAREVQGGQFEPKVESFGLASGVIRFVHSNDARIEIPIPVQDRVQAAMDSIIAGTLDPLAPAPSK